MRLPRWDKRAAGPSRLGYLDLRASELRRAQPTAWIDLRKTKEIHDAKARRITFVAGSSAAATANIYALKLNDSSLVSCLEIDSAGWMRDSGKSPAG